MPNLAFIAGNPFVFIGENGCVRGRAVVGAVKVAYQPEVPHGIAGRGYLRMYLPLPDKNSVLVLDKVRSFSDSCQTETV